MLLDISYLDEATQALQTSVLYVSPSVSDLSQEQQANLSSQIGTDSIAIVVLPAGAQSEIDSIPAFISQLASRTDYETIIVSVGGDFEAGSSTLDSGQASQLANAAEGGNLSDGLNEFVSEVQSNQPSGATSSDGAGIIVPGLSGALGLAVVATLTVLLVRKKRRKPKDNEISYSREGNSKRRLEESRDTPKEIRDLLDSIEEKLSGIRDIKLRTDLVKADEYVHELFMRLRKRMPDKVQQTTGRYKGVLSSVDQLIERYVDIQDKPLFYVSSEKKAQPLLESGAVAMGQYVEGVLQNIRDIESGSLTIFNVDRKILEATVREEEPDLFGIEAQPSELDSKTKPKSRSTFRKQD